MVVPAHVGLAHPNLLWIVVAGVLAFAAGLGVNLYRSRDAGAVRDSNARGERG